MGNELLTIAWRQFVMYGRMANNVPKVQNFQFEYCKFVAFSGVPRCSHRRQEGEAQEEVVQDAHLDAQ